MLDAEKKVIDRLVLILDANARSIRATAMHCNAIGLEKLATDLQYKAWHEEECVKILKEWVNVPPT